MLDLKELERRLDEALEKETSESLTSWILNQRISNPNDFFGPGSFQELPERPCVFNMDFYVSVNYQCVSNNNPSEELAKAA